MYLRVAAWNARYLFSVNGQTISEHGSYSSRTTVQNCTYIQWQGARGSNTLRVQVYGYAVSELFSTRDEDGSELEKRDGGDWTFALSDLVVEDTESTTAGMTSTTPGFSLPTNAAAVSRGKGFDMLLGVMGIALLVSTFL